MPRCFIIFPFALTLAGVGLIESLMTLTLVDEITGTRGQGNRECIGQGVANTVCGLFGGMGGCAMIGQSLINVNSGGRGRLSGITAAVCLLLFVLFLAPLIEMIPIAALVGVMFMVVIGTFEWASIKMARKMPRADTLVMILVAGYTVVFHDLATAVILGVAAAALVFAWQHATHLFADCQNRAQRRGGRPSATSSTARCSSPASTASRSCSTSRMIPTTWCSTSTTHASTTRAGSKRSPGSARSTRPPASGST